MDIPQISYRQRMKRRLYRQQRGGCFYCDTRLSLSPVRTPDQATLDHIIPRSAGGKLGHGNTVLACYACNAERGTMRAEAFLVLKRSGLLGPRKAVSGR